MSDLNAEQAVKRLTGRTIQKVTIETDRIGLMICATLTLDDGTIQFIGESVQSEGALYIFDGET
jgi:hypothetical protein